MRALARPWFPEDGPHVPQEQFVSEYDKQACPAMGWTFSLLCELLGSGLCFLLVLPSSLEVNSIQNPCTKRAISSSQSGSPVPSSVSVALSSPGHGVGTATGHQPSTESRAIYPRPCGSLLLSLIGTAHFVLFFFFVFFLAD